MNKEFLTQTARGNTNIIDSDDNWYLLLYKEAYHMGVARIFQRGGHTDSYRGYSSDCHLNIVSCLLTRRLKKGGSRAPQDPPWLRLWLTILSVQHHLILNIGIKPAGIYAYSLDSIVFVLYFHVLITLMYHLQYLNFYYLYVTSV